MFPPTPKARFVLGGGWVPVPVLGKTRWFEKALWATWTGFGMFWMVNDHCCTQKINIHRPYLSNVFLFTTFHRELHFLHPFPAPNAQWHKCSSCFSQLYFFCICQMYFPNPQHCIFFTRSPWTQHPVTPMPTLAFFALSSQTLFRLRFGCSSVHSFTIFRDFPSALIRWKDII